MKGPALVTGAAGFIGAAVSLALLDLGCDVAGVIAIATGARRPQGPAPDAIYNIGNNRPVQLLHFIEILEGALGRQAMKEMAPMQPGDVYETCADITAIARDYGFAPKTPLEQGLAIFADWFKNYRKSAA